VATKPTAEENTAGIRCPKCKTRTRIRCTAPRRDGTVVRYRYCPVCPFHVKTLESPNQTAK